MTKKKNPLWGTEANHRKKKKVASVICFCVECRMSQVGNTMSAVFDSTSAGSQQMCPVMSWLLCLCLWVSITAIQLCQATFYDTIQQHPGTRPGRTTIHTIGESLCAFSFALVAKTHIVIFLLLPLSLSIHVDFLCV